MNTHWFNLKKLNKVLFAIIMVGLILYFAKPFLIPIAVAFLLAMLLFPFAKKLERMKLSRPFAALVSIGVLLTLLTSLILLIRVQTLALTEDLPDLEKRIKQKTSSIQWVISRETGVSEEEQEEIIEEKKPDILSSITRSLKNFLFRGIYILLMFFVVLVYTFLILNYRKKIHKFLIKLNFFQGEEDAKYFLFETSAIAHNYLRGVFTVISILAVIYTLGFWLIGLKHAFLFAIITATLRIIPYIGSFTGIAFPIVFAFLTKNAIWYPIAVLIFFIATQLLEAYLLTPVITGQKVKLNPLATILAILLGHLLWGVLGMVLFVPLFGILKMVFDQIPSLSPVGYLLGSEED